MTVVIVTLCMGFLFLPYTESQTTGVCSDGGIRLAGGMSYLEGRVEVCFRGQWGTVCDDEWDDRDANVACNQLGYSNEGAVAHGTGDGQAPSFRRGSGMIFLDEIDCSGNESNLLECATKTDCNHDEDAGVTCQSKGVQVVLEHEAQLIPNNSILLLEDNNVTAIGPLLCITTLPSCCDTNRAGNWFPPEGNDPLNNASSGLYQSWTDDQTIELNGLSEEGLLESGLYYCEVPDRENNLQTLYVGIYSSADDVDLSITDMRYEKSSQTVICTSTGGPATSVTWSRDNATLVVDGTTYQQSQTVTDTSTATYQNRLRLVSKSAALSGTYTCSVGNTQGSTLASTKITVCRDNEVRGVAGTEGATPVALQLCVDDNWLTVSNSLEVITEDLPPRNLEITSTEEGLLVSWEEPSTNEEITSYDIMYFAATQPASAQQLTLRVNAEGGATSALLSVLSPETTSYRCCVSSHIERHPGLIFSSEVCETVEYTPLVVSTAQQNSGSILVPILGIVAGVLFLALVVVSLALMVFMKTASTRRKVEFTEITEQEKERDDGTYNSTVRSPAQLTPAVVGSVPNPIYASINQENGGTSNYPESTSPTSIVPNVSNPMYSSIDGLEARRSFIVHHRNEQRQSIQRSSSSSAVSGMKTRTSEEPIPLYTAIVPRHLRNNDATPAGEQEGDVDPQEDADADPIPAEETQTYSILNHQGLQGEANPIQEETYSTLKR